jgi:hypothetical protein
VGQHSPRQRWRATVMRRGTYPDGHKRGRPNRRVLISVIELRAASSPARPVGMRNSCLIDYRRSIRESNSASALPAAPPPTRVDPGIDWPAQAASRLRR